MSDSTNALKPLSSDMQQCYRDQAKHLAAIAQWQSATPDRIAEALMRAHQTGYEIGRYSVDCERFTERSAS